MLINGLNRTRILIALVLVLLLNSFLCCPRAAHSFSKATRSVKALLLGQSKTSHYKVLLYEHSIYRVNTWDFILSNKNCQEVHSKTVPRMKNLPGPPEQQPCMQSWNQEGASNQFMLLLLGALLSLDLLRSPNPLSATMTRGTITTWMGGG
jgi:hypothetical protein